MDHRLAWGALETHVWTLADIPRPACEFLVLACSCSREVHKVDYQEIAREAAVCHFTKR